MGYFSNATEADIYEQEWCERCVNYMGLVDDMCAVMAAHQLWQSDHTDVLGEFIPLSADGARNLQCTMFFAGECRRHPRVPADSPDLTAEKARTWWVT